jgi:FkbM family methyltransferase
MLPRVNLVRGDKADFLLFSTNDTISVALYADGIWDGHLIEISRLFHADTQSPLVLDIGANLGAYAIPVAKEIAAQGGEVFCYEPQRIIYYQLCGNIFLNRLDNVHAFQMAIGAQDGEISIPTVDYLKTFNVGGFSLDSAIRQATNYVVTKEGQDVFVPLISLDSLSLPRSPCLVKIDVEGMDLQVLSGGKEFFARNNFPPILFEAWPFDFYAEEKQKIFELLHGWGYVTHPIMKDDFIAQHPSYPRQVAFSLKDGILYMQRTR